MTAARKDALTRHRNSLKKQGRVRLEVQVRADDAPLVKGIANALNDPDRERETRALLLECVGPDRAKGLKALLAAAPLEGIELGLDRDGDRKVDL